MTSSASLNATVPLPVVRLYSVKAKYEQPASTYIKKQQRSFDKNLFYEFSRNFEIAGSLPLKISQVSHDIIFIKLLMLHVWTVGPKEPP